MSISGYTQSITAFLQIQDAAVHPPEVIAVKYSIRIFESIMAGLLRESQCYNLNERNSSDATEKADGEGEGDGRGR